MRDLLARLLEMEMVNTTTHPTTLKYGSDILPIVLEDGVAFDKATKIIEMLRHHAEE